MNPNQQPPQNPQTPPQQPNQFTPPAPGPYVPPGQPAAPQQVQRQAQQQPMQPTPQPAAPQQPPLQIDQQIANKKRQAKLFMVAAAVFVLLFILGIIMVIVLYGSSNSNDGASSNNLSVEEQLKFDVNRLGLAVINYNNGSDTFEATPADTAALKTGYLPTEFSDPRTGNPYILTTAIPVAGELQYVAGGVCEADDSVSQSSDPSNFAIRVLLENESTLYCLERSEVQQISEPPAP